MNKFVLGLAAAGLVASASVASAQTAPVLSNGTYKSTGTVAQDNGKCAAVGLTQGSASTSRITYPGAGATGFNLYTGAGGLLQLCNRYPAVPAGGLNNWTVTAQCAIYDTNFTIKAQPVTFSFTSTTTDPNTAIGTTTVSIPTTDTVGPGCVATVYTTLVNSGH